MSEKDPTQFDLSALMNQDDDQGFSEDLAVMFTELEPKTDPQFTVSVIDRLGADRADLKLWTILGACLLSLVLIASQFSSLSSLVGSLATPVLADSAYGSAETLTGALIALLILGVGVVLPQRQLR